jgi:hypothetical protein
MITDLLRIGMSFLGGWQRILIYGALALAAFAVAAGWGYHRGVRQLWDYQIEQAKTAVKIITKIEKVKEIVRVPYVKREIEIVEVFKTIEKEVERVPERAACNVTAGWMRAHDHAASGQDRSLDGDMDDARDTGVTERQVLAEAVIPNYKAFHQVANDLKACRAFVRGVAAITSE